MKVMVIYAGRPREVVGKTREIAELREGSKLRDLMRVLTDKHGQKFEINIYSKEKDKIADNIVIMHNGKTTHNLNEVLNDGDYVTLISPIAGG